MSKKNLAPHKYGRLRGAVMLLLLLGTGLEVNAQEGTKAQEELKAANKAVRTRQYARAFNLYRQAAAKGDPEAQYQVANLYSLGMGVRKDEKTAIAWLEKSAQMGHAGAKYGVAMKILDRDFDRAVKLINESAKEGYGPAKTYLERQGTSKSLRTVADAKTDLWFGAASNNDINALERLLASHRQVDMQDEAGRTALFPAIEAGRREAIDWLLQKGASPNHRDKYGINPLFLAVAEDQKALFQLLVDRGADIKQTLPNGDNLLHYTIRRKRFDLVSTLVQRGLPVNAKNNAGWTPLDLAQYANATKTAAALKKKGAITGEAWSTESRGQNFQLLATRLSQSIGVSEVGVNEAAKIVVNGNAPLLKEIVERQPQLLNQRLEDGSTLLSLAVRDGSDSVVKTLLAAGAEANQPLKGNGATPLHVAARAGKVEAILQLLSAGANPLALDSQRTDAVDSAIAGEQDRAALVLLKWLTADSQNVLLGRVPFDRYLLLAAKHNLPTVIERLGPYTKVAEADDLGRNALWYAARNKNAEIIPELVSYGVPSEVIDHQGKTPLYVAVDNECYDCVKFLLPHSDFNQQTQSGNSALIAAARKGNDAIVKLLLENNADLKLRNKLGNTALITAIEHEATNAALLLVEAGANIARKNNLGFSALDIAERKNADVLPVLRERRGVLF